jgi:prevent-host-death family protein
MIVITASETRKWGEITRQAQRDTIEVQSHGVPAVYILGVEEYRDLQAVKKAALEEKLLRASQGIDRGEISTATPTDIAKQAKARYGL